MYYTYVLESARTFRYYIGSCSDPALRLAQHNAGKTYSTRLYRPWKMIYCERCATRGRAMAREYQIKSYKGGCAFQKLIADCPATFLKNIKVGGVPPQAA